MIWQPRLPPRPTAMVRENGLMHRSKARGLLNTSNLPALQNLLKREPEAYAEEFLAQWNHYESLRRIYASGIGQQVDDAVTFQIAQDRAVALAFAPGPVVDAENTDFRHWIGNRLTDAAQQRRGADRDCHPTRQARSGITAQCQGDGMVQGAKTIGVASPGLSYYIGTFGEGPLAADGVYTAEAADAHQKNKLTSQTGNVA